MYEGLPRNRKRCTACGDVKRRNQFYTRAESPDGRSPVCIACTQARPEFVPSARSYRPAPRMRITSAELEDARANGVPIGLMGFRWENER